MSGGMKEIVFNPSERAVSSDVLRLQYFKGADVAELFRALMDTSTTSDDLDANAIDVQVTGAGNPSSGEIINGLRVVPQVGNLSLLVTPGVAFIYDPDASPSADESQYKYLNDPGIPTVGSLLITPGGGGTRIDVIECARVGTPIPGTTTGFSVLETDNRDIFNNVSGLFTPQTVNKVVAGRLQYRVRAGTPGGGYPGTASGWLPLAILSMPSSGTTCNDATFWDVRPLVCDRVLPPFNSSVALPLWKRAQYTVDTVLSAGKALLLGDVQTMSSDPAFTSNAKYRLGGRLRRGTPGRDLSGTIGYDGVDLNDVANMDPGASGFATGGIGYIYLANFLSLPRMARYTDYQSGQRIPRSCRGLLVVSNVAPTEYGSPGSNITSPTSTGFATTTQDAVCIGAVLYGAGGLAGATVADGKTQWCAGTFPAVNGAVSGPGVTDQIWTFTLTGGTSHPANAKALYVHVNLNNFVPANSGVIVVAVSVLDSTSGESFALAYQEGTNQASGGGIPGDVNFTCRIPLPATYPLSAAATINPVRKVNVEFTSSATQNATTATLQVLGYDLY